MIPTLFFLIVLILAFRARKSCDRALSSMVTLWLFSGQGAIILSAAGGANIAPAVMFLPFLIVYAWRDEGLGPWASTLAFPNAGFWLLLLLIVGATGAAFLPRLFEGSVYIFTTVRSDQNLGGVLSIPLTPGSGNITQPTYLVGALAIFATCVLLLRSAERQALFTTLVLRLATINVGIAVWNLGELYLGLPAVLDVVRKMSGYAVMDASSVGGLGRITGAFPEASGFAGFTLPLFAYCLRLWLSGSPHSRRAGLLAATNGVLLLLSTSSTAYAGLLAYVALYALYRALKGAFNLRGPRIGLVAGLVWLALIALCLTVLFKPEWLDATYTYFESTLIRKHESLSGIERGSWNTRAWGNFLDTWGLGVGLGSARASSFPLVLLSNVGLPGTTLFALFIGAVAHASRTSGLSPTQRANAAAAGHAVFAILVSGSVSATVFDLGLPFYCYAAAASAAAIAARSSGKRPATASAVAA